jgi:homogentisate 1,2-dioxygenase
MPYSYRDMVGDLLYFVHRGSGTFATEFGPIAYEPGDWVLLPKATTFQQVPDPSDSLLLVVESPNPIRMAEHENVGRHTPIDPTMLDVPDVVDYRRPAQAEYEVCIRHQGGHSSIFYRNDPLNVVGWKGDLFPFKLNVRSILPIMSDRIHIPPSSWVTFEAPGFCVLTIPPMPTVSDRASEELPSYHRNIDMDEVMLGHADTNPDGRRPRMFRHTPQGILHGADEATRSEFQKKRKPSQHRTATMVGVDTYRPLGPTAEFVRMGR